jgi:diguanylate cyclase (GGDEF)-like protein
MDIECPLNNNLCPVANEVMKLREECRKLRELSQIDPLTELYNFRYLLNALEKEMERTRRTGLVTSLIMLDLDHFKRVNDTLGHEAGNSALKWISRLIRENIRRIDIPCRYGGEEFTIILPGIRLGQAVQAAERLRSSLESNPVVLEGESRRLTASFGVESYDIRDNLSVEEFIKRTDSYLLEAKEKGRNRVCSNQDYPAAEWTEVTTDERESLMFISSAS